MVKFRLAKIKKVNYRELDKILLITLLVLSFIIRIINFEPSHYTEDFNVSYLVSYHIIKYHEFPLVGPWSGTLQELKNSPVYFYLLSFFLSINNHPLFLNIANIFLQLLTITTIFLLAQKAFGTLTALSSIILFSFSKVSLDQSLFSIWQPFVAQPFVNLSYLLLLFAFIKLSFNLLWLGTFFFILAGALHNSIFSLLPLFLSLCFFILIKWRGKIHHYTLLILTVIFCFTIFFLPWLIYLNQNNLSILKFLSTRMNTNILYGLLQRVAYDTSTFIDNFFFLSGKEFLSLNMFILIIVIFTFLFYFLFKNDSPIRKYYSLVIVLFLIYQSIFIGLIDSKDPSFLSPSVWGIIRYFTPIYSLFVILIAHIIHSVFTGNIALRTIKAVLIILLLNTFSNGLGDLLQTTRGNLISFKHYYNPAVEAIKSEILALREKDSASNLNFFQLRTIGLENINSYFWVVLERDLDSKFVKTSDVLWNSYATINDDKYIFLICYQNNINPTVERMCQDKFISQNQNYQVLSRIYSQDPFSIYLTKR